VGLDTVHLPWLVSVGLVKLIMVASFGIMGAGAVLTRIARNAEMHARANIGSGADYKSTVEHWLAERPLRR
jgi:hypothetical protein